MENMINKVKAYFKTLAKECNKTELKEKVKSIVKHPDLTEEEKWLVYYTYGEERMVLNTCNKLSMSERRFYMVRDIAFIKLYYILHL